MNQKALKTLEFDKIIHRLTGARRFRGSQREVLRELVRRHHPSGRLNVPRRRPLTRFSRDLAKGKCLLRRYP